MFYIHIPISYPLHRIYTQNIRNLHKQYVTVLTFKHLKFANKRFKHYETKSDIAINYKSNPKDANIKVNLLFLVSSTCFGRCFRPSSEALDCIYNIW
jgi:hypothetical protein